MDIRKLTYFVETVNERSFSRAAQKLYLSQPMLSKAIQQMEEELGVQLIKRSSKSFLVTEAGRVVYRQCVKIINDYNELEHLFDDREKLMTGVVSLNIPAIIVSLYFRELLIDIQNRYPGISLTLFEDGANAVLNSVLCDTADIGVVMQPVPTQDIDSYPIIKDKCTVVVSKDHPLAGRKAVSMSELEHEKFIIFNRNFVLHDLIRQNCYAAGFSPQITFQSSRIPFILDMVAQNRGITILPGPSVSDEAEEFSKIDLIPEIPWSLALVIRKDKYLSPAALQVIKCILQHFDDWEIKNNLE